MDLRRRHHEHKEFHDDDELAGSYAPQSLIKEQHPITRISIAT